jgi:hypothetical protein
VAGAAEDSRRFLIAAAVTQYRSAPAWDRPELGQARTAIIDLFSERFGYEHPGILALNPTKDELARVLREFCRAKDRQSDDFVVVYLAGHEEVLDDAGFEHVFLTADTDPDDIHDALPTVDLVRKMLAGTRLRRLMLLLDTCYSGHGANDLVAAALTRFTRTWGTQTGAGLVVVTSAQPFQQAEAGAFPELLRAAVESCPLRAMHRSAWISAWWSRR